MASSICPFTLKPIADIPSDNVAIIHHESIQCGRCTLSKLIPYLHEGISSRECPVCQASNVTTVYDVDSALMHRQQQSYVQAVDTKGTESDLVNLSHECPEGRIVSFKYGTISYHLWVEHDSIALQRIASVMGMDVSNGLKIIYKGKIIYPSSSISIVEASEQILDISNADFLHCRKKPSLVLMGLRQSAANNLASTTSGCSYANMFKSLATTLLWPSNILNNARHGIQFTWQIICTILGGIYLFARSLLYPPEPRAD